MGNGTAHITFFMNNTDGYITSKEVIVQKDTPETPSGRNKAGRRTIIIRENAKQLIKLRKRIREEEAIGSQARTRRLFPFKHGPFSVMFTRMKQKQIKESTKK